MAVERYFFHTPPNSSAPAREAVRVGLDSPPRSAIVDVVGNPEARDLLPRELKYLATSAFLTENIFMSVPLEKSTRATLTPFHSGRAVVTGFGVMPFGEAVGSVVTGKGSWLAGDKIRQIEKHWDMAGIGHPGLLTVEGAKDDMELSNTLLHAGYRTALHTGYVIFNNHILQDWLLDKWRGTDHEVYIGSSFHNAVRNGGTAYLYRLGGSTERLDNYQTGQSENGERRLVEMTRSARMLLLESAMADSQMQRALSDIDDEYKETSLAALLNIANGHAITYREQEAYAHLLAALCARNVVAFAKVSEQLPGKHLNGYVAGEPKDIDLGFFNQDYDIAETEEEIPADQNRFRYIHTTHGSIIRYFAFMKRYFEKGHIETLVLHYTNLLTQTES